jgi:hypothetical protein
MSRSRTSRDALPHRTHGRVSGSLCAFIAPRGSPPRTARAPPGEIALHSRCQIQMCAGDLRQQMGYRTPADYLIRVRSGTALASGGRPPLCSPAFCSIESVCSEPAHSYEAHRHASREERQRHSFATASARGGAGKAKEFLAGSPEVRGCLVHRAGAARVPVATGPRAPTVC